MAGDGVGAGTMAMARAAPGPGSGSVARALAMALAMAGSGALARVRAWAWAVDQMVLAGRLFMASYDWTDENAEIQGLREKVKQIAAENAELLLQIRYLNEKIRFLEGLEIPQTSNPPGETL